MPNQPIPQSTKMPMNNPLANYFRQPKIYIKLPSGGEFYPDGALDLSDNHEYAVYAMTAKDELLFKTPDALMNGQATVEVIKSCVPAIKNPWKMPTIDVDAVLVAIRIATYDTNMDITAKCPSCSFVNDYEFNLLTYLDQMGSFKYNSRIESEPLIVNIRPYNYQEITKSAIKAIEQQKIFQIVNDESLSEEEKLDKFGSSFLKLTELTVEIICGCIHSIETPEGVVSNQSQISEFIANAPSNIFNKISEHITSMRNDIEMKTQNVQCEECKHQYQISVTMDQSNFFAVRS